MLCLVAGALEAGVAPSGERRSFPTDSMKGAEGEGRATHHTASLHCEQVGVPFHFSVALKHC